MRHRKLLKRSILGVCAAFFGAYITVTAPVVPYFMSDIQEKRHTEQNDPLEYLKSFWGAFVWYPQHRVGDMFHKGLEKKVLVVNKATQQIFVYDADGAFEFSAPTSTGKHQGVKTRYDQRVTPPGRYIAVRRLDEEGIHRWYGDAIDESHGRAELNFLGHWFPNIAVHGTSPEGEKYLGQEKSMGCPRVDESTALYLRDHAAVGTRLVVHEYAVLPVMLPEGFIFSEYLAAEGDASSRRAAQRTFLQNNPFVKTLEDLVPGQTYFFKDYNGNGVIDGIQNSTQ